MLSCLAVGVVGRHLVGVWRGPDWGIRFWVGTRIWGGVLHSEAMALARCGDTCCGDAAVAYLSECGCGYL